VLTMFRRGEKCRGVSSNFYDVECDYQIIDFAEVADEATRWHKSL